MTAKNVKVKYRKSCRVKVFSDFFFFKGSFLKLLFRGVLEVDFAYN